MSLIRSEKKSCFSDINARDIRGNKTFWKIVKHFLTDKIQLNLK